MKLNKKKKISIFIVSILLILALAGIILVKIYNPEKESFFIPCALYTLTGIKCPGCGMTRAVHNLVNGNIIKSMWYNLMLIPLIVIITYSLYRFIRYLVKDEEIINNILETMLKIFLAMLIIFGIARNFTTLFY